MKLHTSNYQRILDEKQISGDYVMRAAGLSKKSYDWILNNSYIEWETLERIADAIGVEVKEIAAADSDTFTENVIEFIKDSKVAGLTLSQGRHISRIRELAEKFPDKCRIDVENKDGSILARIPVSWIRINPEKQLTDEQRERRAEIMRQVRAGNNSHAVC